MSSRVRYTKRTIRVISDITSVEDLFIKLKIQWQAIEPIIDKRINGFPKYGDKKLARESFSLFAALVAEADAVFKNDMVEYRKQKKERMMKKINKDSDNNQPLVPSD